MQIHTHGICLSKRLAAPNITAVELASIRTDWEHIERDLGVTLMPAMPDEDFCASEDLIRNRVFPFLDKTGLVISGDELQNLLEFRIDGKQYMFSFREWGSYQAEWMNNHPELKKLRHFEYINFYMAPYVSSIFTDYEYYMSNLRLIRA